MSKKMSNEAVSKEERCCQICQTDFESGFITSVRVVACTRISANIYLTEGIVDTCSVENVWMHGSNEDMVLAQRAAVH